LLAAMDDPTEANMVGSTDPSGLTGPAAIDAVDTDNDHDSCWRALEQTRRDAAGWAPSLAD
jgi:hypothetical protein